jgi:exopolysaccharide biosynthesis polyprenyl glycosylphosphotransferase
MGNLPAMLQREDLIKKIALLCDFIIICAAFKMAVDITAGSALTAIPRPLGFFGDHFLFLVVTIATYFTVFFFLGYYTGEVETSSSLILITTFRGVLISFILLSSGAYLFGILPLNRRFIVSFALFSFCGLFMFKLIRCYVQKKLGHWSFPRKNMVLCGNWRRAQELIRRIPANYRANYRVVAFLSSNGQQPGPEEKEFSGIIFDSIENLETILVKNVVDEVIFTLDRDSQPESEKWILVCEKLGVTMRVLVNCFKATYAKTYIDLFYGIPILTYTTIPFRDKDMLVKRIIDILGSLAGIILLFPAFLLIAFVIKLENDGPVFYRQIRLGQYGRKFTLYKFRSMVANADELKLGLLSSNEMNGPVFKMKDDPRVTRVGKFLRKFSLDELPQIFNVLNGELSLVGPRPALPEEAEQYDLGQRRRLSMKPGMTCLWQIQGRNTIDFDEWMKLDLEYIDRWSLWLDLVILLRTVPAILSARGAC